MKKFTVSKEFFGGIVCDKENSQNLKIDSLVYDLIKVITKKCKIEDFVERYKGVKDLEIIEIMQEMIEIGLFVKNFDLYEYNNCKGILNAPFRVFYDISYACNLRCKHCFTESGTKEENELTLQEKIKFADDCISLGVGRISIAGGEPLYCRDLYPFLDYCTSKELSVSITTNGTLLSEENVKRLNHYNIKTVTISLDGATEKSCESIRGKGNLSSVLSGLKNMHKFYKKNYAIKTTIMKNNILEIEDLILLAIKVQCPNIKFNSVREDGRAKENSREVIISTKEYIEAVKKIEEMKRKYGKQISIKAPLNPYCDEEYYYIKELGFGCFAGKESICVDPLGNVRPCSHFPEEFICGNVRVTALKDIWYESEVLNIFRGLSGNKECLSCVSYDKCRGGCRYRAFVDGDINGLDPYCYKHV